MSERIVFSVPGLAPASWSGNSRAHWRKRHADGTEYEQEVWMAQANQLHTSPQCKFCQRTDLPWPRAKVTLTQRAVRPRDHDNFLSSFKPGLDTLTTKGKRPLGIVLDDNPECLTIEVKTERVKHKRDEAVVVEIEKR